MWATFACLAEVKLLHLVHIATVDKRPDVEIPFA